MEKSSEPWIFLSHANADIAAVRRVRNKFEVQGAHPILFYLRQQVNDALLWSLIKSEIEARRFFALCESEASRRSSFVQREVELVRSLPKKRYAMIDLASPIDEQDSVVGRLLRDTTVFCSFANVDAHKVSIFATELAAEDFRVWRAEDIAAGSDWGGAIRDGIDAAADGGFFLLFLSRASLASKWVRAELDTFLSMASRWNTDGPGGRRLIPVRLEQIPASDLPTQIAHLQWFDASGSDLVASARRLADMLTTIPTGP